MKLIHPHGEFSRSVLESCEIIPLLPLLPLIPKTWGGEPNKRRWERVTVESKSHIRPQMNNTPSPKGPVRFDLLYPATTGTLKAGAKVKLQQHGFTTLHAGTLYLIPSSRNGHQQLTPLVGSALRIAPVTTVAALTATGL